MNLILMNKLKLLSPTAVDLLDIVSLAGRNINCWPILKKWHLNFSFHIPDLQKI